MAKTTRREWRFGSIQELCNLHDDAVSCDDCAYADRIKAELTSRGWKPPVVVTSPEVVSEPAPF